MFLLLLLLSLISACVSGEYCDRGWTGFDHKCYFKRETKGSFDENSEWCQSMNATMVSVHSKDQNDFLRGFIHSKLTWLGTNSGGWTWLGCKQIRPGSAQVECVDGTDFDYKSKFYGSHLYPSSDEVHGLAMFRDGDWLYIPLSTPHHQMCQKEENFRVKIEVEKVIRDLKQSVDKQQNLEKNIVSLNKTLQTQLLLHSKEAQKLSEVNKEWEKRLDSFDRKLSQLNSSQSVLKVHEMLDVMNSSIYGHLYESSKKGLEVSVFREKANGTVIDQLSHPRVVLDLSQMKRNNDLLTATVNRMDAELGDMKGREFIVGISVVVLFVVSMLSLLMCRSKGKLIPVYYSKAGLNVEAMDNN